MHEFVLRGDDTHPREKLAKSAGLYLGNWRPMLVTHLTEATALSKSALSLDLSFPIDKTTALMSSPSAPQ